ncbi:MAG: endonuclease/exonuclease/phosphatase family protein [Proteobacteria bacterium]|nr:endonuclease/exonuclease/phosphatase family protein [Pseudomonadota bacterium]MCH7957546.1 endonuclease/exonuclease/phosphatase family protein [Pseudomonadota bacterium]MCH8214284.1 endonuclease/exonuclease/phosphatase family protein [Pseudomonadota bacterium]
MFHGTPSPEVARGLKILRKRIGDAVIPPSKLDETLNLATWNIREFGRKRNNRRRSHAAIHYIAEILSQFDLIGITEVRDDLTDLGRVMDILGPYWRAVFSDFSADRAGNRERMAYLYDKRAVTFTGLAAEADPPRKKNRKTGKYEPVITWWRSPYMASFRAGNFDFILISVHIRWGDGAEARIPPLKALARWIDKRRREKHVVDKDIILMGDFNIPALDDPLFKAITSKGLTIADALRDLDRGSNLARNKRYDQILHYRRHTKTIGDIGGILDFFDDDWRALFPKAEYPDMDKNAFTYQLSDHLPLWVQLDTWIDDEELDQIINRARRGAGRHA